MPAGDVYGHRKHRLEPQETISVADWADPDHGRTARPTAVARAHRNSGPRPHHRGVDAHTLWTRRPGCTDTHHVGSIESATRFVEGPALRVEDTGRVRRNRWIVSPVAGENDS